MARLDARWNNFTERGQAWDHFWQDAAPAGGATTYTISGNTALTFAVASAEAAVFAEPASAALTFGVASAFEYTPGLTVYTASGDVALSFGVASPFQFVSGVTETPGGSGGRIRWRLEGVPWKPPAVVFTHHGLAAIALHPRCATAHLAIPPAAIAAPKLGVRARRQFVNVPPPLEPLAEDVAVLLAAVL